VHEVGDGQPGVDEQRDVDFYRSDVLSVLPRLAEGVGPCCTHAEECGGLHLIDRRIGLKPSRMSPKSAREEPGARRLIKTNNWLVGFPITGLRLDQFT